MGAFHPFVISKILYLFQKFDLADVLKRFNYLNKNDLSDIKFPVLLIYSYKDKLATFRMGKKFHKRILQSNLFLLKDRPHSSLLAKSIENGSSEQIDKFIQSLKK